MTEPQPTFEDRLLTCADCHGEFVFTAGEQLFFHDKQFKNDPKRCKPCKSRRSGLAAAANGAGPASAGLSRTETRTECSECKIQTTVPFKPTQGRPVLCRQCFQLKGKAAALSAPPVRTDVEAPMPLAAAGVPTPFEVVEAAHQAQTISALTVLSETASGSTLSAEAAALAAAVMASASPQSSIASAADLASIAGSQPVAANLNSIPAELLAQEHAPAVLAAAELPADATEA